MLLAAVSSAVAIAAAGWYFRQDMGAWWYQRTGSVPDLAEKKPVPDPDTYVTLSAELEKWRADLAVRYSKAKSAAEREVVERDARLVLEQVLPAMMRCWLGTPWDFHGTAEAPGGGKIACGYFVATVLKDAGFRVDRYKLAQQASENIMRSFVSRESCKLTVGQQYDAFVDGLAEFPAGIYIVGLDTHVAFLLVDGEGFRFIHSSGSAPWCVVDEGRDEAVVLKKSNWRMLGNFTGDAGVIRSWLKGGRIEVKGA